MNVRNILICLCLVFATHFSSAQTEVDHVFKGTVFVDGEKAKNVTVKILKNGEAPFTFKTKSNGKIFLASNSEETYTLNFEKEGYKTQKVVINTMNTKNLMHATKLCKFDVYLEEKITEDEETETLSQFATIELDKETKEFRYRDNFTKSLVAEKR